jgi:hypothetical protein
MGKGFSFKSEGLDKALKRLQERAENMEADVDAVIKANINDIEVKAKSRLASFSVTGIEGGTGLKTSWYLTPYAGENSKGWQLGNSNKVAPYLEFGTGTNVFQGEYWVTDELANYAKQFYVNGKGRLYPHPFLYNSAFEQLPLLVEDLKNLLNEKSPK